MGRVLFSHFPPVLLCCPVRISLFYKMVISVKMPGLDNQHKILYSEYHTTNINEDGNNNRGHRARRNLSKRFVIKQELSSHWNYQT